LEAALEKVNWYRHEIKRLRSDLANWDSVGGGPGNLVGAQDRDPMEAYNLLVERRKELQRLQHNGQGLDKVAAAQKRAEAAQNALSPELEERLRRKKEEVAQQKRLNIRLQADRQKVDEARKKAEREVRAANNDVRSKASQLKRPPRPGNNVASGGAADADVEQKKLRNLQRDVDILSSAIRQDERKFKAAEREDEQQLEMTRRQITKLTADIAGHEAEIAKLRADLKRTPRGGGPQPETLKPAVLEDLREGNLQEEAQQLSREELPVSSRTVDSEQVNQEELENLTSQIEDLGSPLGGNEQAQTVALLAEVCEADDVRVDPEVATNQQVAEERPPATENVVIVEEQTPVQTNEATLDVDGIEESLDESFEET
jgi:DNA repair exonuclease SbcCD ATPase subunit